MATVNSSETDGAAVRIPPPLVYLAAVIAGVLFDAYVSEAALPLTFRARVMLGLLFAAAGLTLIGFAFMRFRATGQNPEPWKSSPEVIRGGIYRYTRNPMYVGMALLQTSVGFGLGNAWVIVLVPASLVAVYFVAVRHEEEYLAAKFGEGYLVYKRSVRRWL